MKALFVIFFLSFGFLSNNEKLDQCNGIENFTFGSVKENYKGLTLEIQEGNTHLYDANTNTLQISNVEFEFMRLTFTKNKLTAIALSTKNGTRAAFFNYLKEKYGSPQKLKNRFEWVGKKVNIVFEFYNNNKDAAIDFYAK